LNAYAYVACTVVICPAHALRCLGKGAHGWPLGQRVVGTLRHTIIPAVFGSSYSLYRLQLGFVSVAHPTKCEMGGQYREDTGVTDEEVRKIYERVRVQDCVDMEDAESECGPCPAGKTVVWEIVETKRVGGRPQAQWTTILPDLARMLERAFQSDRASICVRYYTDKEAKRIDINALGHIVGGVPYTMDTNYMVQIRGTSPFTSRRLRRSFHDIKVEVAHPSGEDPVTHAHSLPQSTDDDMGMMDC